MDQAASEANGSTGLAETADGIPASGELTALGACGEVSLRLRVGICGHRTLTRELDSLASEIAKAIEYITQKLAASPDGIADGTVTLTAVSALAEGADRIVAAKILEVEGSQLEVVLPLPPAEYRKDFTSDESMADFDQLLARDDRYDLVRTAESRDHAYELAGRTIVDRSDVMIVVWDGGPSRGRGGTSEIYNYARTRRKPVLLIHTDENTATLDTTQLPDRAERTLPMIAANLEQLERYNKEQLAMTDMESQPALLSNLTARPWLLGAAPLVEHINGYFVRADQLANRLQRRWLWINRTLYMLAPLAVLTIAVQVNFAPSQDGFAWFEFAILAILTLLHIATRKAGWHLRWITARYLAEQIRSLMFLGLTGLITLVNTGPVASGQVIGEVGWTERAANEIWLTRPRFEPPDDLPLLIDVLYREWIAKQQQYHRATSRSYERRNSRLQAASVGLFSLSAIAALLHSVGAGGTSAHPFRWWDFLAIVIPAVGGALSGYGAQRDYVRHAERSRLLALNLENALDRMLSARNLHDIQQIALAITRSMRDEATDWFSAVHSQDVELSA